ncbi:MAG: tRNA (adenosine(37)-N6)-threonylcarbamoyltransferase complex ATPase subunit type 1 TsaE [Phycisphaerae bacterium]
MNRTWTVETNSPEETIALGRAIGRAAAAGDIFALVGELGSGKTHLAKGIAEGLGAARARDVTSPSFVLCREYLGGRLPFYHLDAYRLSGARDLEAIGAEEMFFGEGVSALEWADRAPGVLPEDYLEVRFDVTGDRARRLTLTPRGPRAEQLLARLRSEQAAP